MTRSDPGWAWFETDNQESDGEEGSAGAQDAELADVFGRCFRGPDGARALRHLRGLTLERALGPDCSDALLRYVEGQRQLVTYIHSLVQRSNGSPSAGDVEWNLERSAGRKSSHG